VGAPNALRWVGRARQTGGSIAVIIPKELIEHLQFRRGDYMGIDVLDECDAVIPVDSTSIIRPTSRLVMRRLTQSMVIERDA